MTLQNMLQQQINQKLEIVIFQFLDNWQKKIRNLNSAKLKKAELQENMQIVLIGLEMQI